MIWVLMMLFLSETGSPVGRNETSEPLTITYETHLTMPACRNGDYSRITVKEGVIELVVSPSDFGGETLRSASRVLTAEEKADIDSMILELERAAPSIETVPSYAAVKYCHNRLWLGSTLKAKWPTDHSSFPRVSRAASDLIQAIWRIEDSLYAKALEQGT